MEKRPNRAIPIVAPPKSPVITLSESPEEKAPVPAPVAVDEAAPSTSKDNLKVPTINIEAASTASEGSEDEAVVPDKSESGDSGHEDSCSEPDAHDFSAMAAARAR